MVQTVAHKGEDGAAIRIGSFFIRNYSYFSVYRSVVFLVLYSFLDNLILLTGFNVSSSSSMQVNKFIAQSCSSGSG